MEGKEKTEWLIIMPDYEGVLERRMSVRPYVVIFSLWLLAIGLFLLFAVRLRLGSIRFPFVFRCVWVLCGFGSGCGGG